MFNGTRSWKGGQYKSTSWRRGCFSCHNWSRSYDFQIGFSVIAESKLVRLGESKYPWTWWCEHVQLKVKVGITILWSHTSTAMMTAPPLVIIIAWAGETVIGHWVSWKIMSHGDDMKMMRKAAVVQRHLHGGNNHMSGSCPRHQICSVLNYGIFTSWDYNRYWWRWRELWRWCIDYWHTTASKTGTQYRSKARASVVACVGAAIGIEISLAVLVSILTLE